MCIIKTLEFNFYGIKAASNFIHRMSKFVGADWASLMSEYENFFEQGDQIELSISSLFQKLTKVLERKSALFWHVKTFDRYIEEQINSVGLRVQIFPNADLISDECKTEWETNLKSCSREMMAILSREYNKQITLLDTVITNLEQALILYAQHTLFSELQATLKDNLSVFNKGILQNKEIQFWRDKSAFSEGRAYRWNNHLAQSKYYPRRESKNNKSKTSKSKTPPATDSIQKNSSQRG